MKTLDAETKVKLLDGFSSQRKYTSIVMFGVLLVYLLLLKFFSDYSMLIIGVFGMLFMLYFIISRVLNYQKIALLGASEEYLRMYKLSTCLVGAGFIGVGLQLFWLFHLAY